MFFLVYDSSMWNDESITEIFNTIDELLARYEEIQYEFCEFRAFDEDGKRIVPWLKSIKS